MATDDAVTAALAVTKEDTAALSPEDRAAIAKRKAANVVAAQMAGTSWGKGMDTATQRAVSDWGGRHGIDVSTEIHVLGGNIYLNAQFYINRLVDLVKAGRVLDFRQRFLNPDPRLDEIADEVLPATASEAERLELADAQAAARRERRERRELRIRHNVPNSATSAVLTEVFLTNLPHTPFIGVKWAPHGDNDPVGKNFPQETALTRSARRALKQCIRHLPEVARYVDGAEDDAATSVSAVLVEQVRAQLAGGAQPAPESRQLSAGPLSVDEAAAASRIIPEAEHVRAARGSVPVLSPEQIGRIVDNTADPYTVPPAAAAPAPIGDDLFGGASPIEPARGADIPDDVSADDWDIMTPDERNEAIAHASRRRK